MNPRPVITTRIWILAALICLGIGASTAQAQVQVTAADPSAASQGTTELNVKITGKGFKKGAQAKWFVSGTTDTGGVTVNSTTFVNGGELTANISVSDSATIANFDIAVANTDGRGGKGTELFAVQSATNATSTIFDNGTDSSTLLLRSDDLNPDLTSSGGSFGIYQTSTVTNVLSRFEGASNSDWDVHLENSASRWVSLTLNRVSGSGPTGTYTLPARVLSRCFDPTGSSTNTVGWQSITTSDPNCSFRVNFNLSGTQYALVMSPYYASTGRATVSCNVVSGGLCSDWSVTPNLTQDNIINPNPNVAVLFSVAPKNGKTTTLGYYRLTYRVRVTYP